MNDLNQFQCLSRCDCGSTRVLVRTNHPMHTSAFLDCHCHECRFYHVSAFASYLKLSMVDVSIESSKSENGLQFFRDACVELGRVDRIACRSCHTKIATQPVKNRMDEESFIYINMGSMLQSALLDQDIAGGGREIPVRTEVQTQERASWAQARPHIKSSDRYRIISKDNSVVWKGSCKCGRYPFALRHTLPTELQHCYCQKCRHLSGSAFMTWTPARRSDLRWTLHMPPPLVRTTPHGQRHICEQCGSAMTIVYDSQPDLVWPAMGCVHSMERDDGTQGDPGDVSYGRVLHICCQYRPEWYELPDDGLPRVSEAS